MKILAYFDSDYEPVVVGASGGNAMLQFAQRVSVDPAGNIDDDKYYDDYLTYPDQYCVGPIFISYEIAKGDSIGERDFSVMSAADAADVIIDLLTNSSHGIQSKLPKEPGDYMIRGYLEIDFDVENIKVYEYGNSENDVDTDDVEIITHTPVLHIESITKIS